MKLFECQHCGQALYFENTRCESCGRSLGYLPSKETVTALDPDSSGQNNGLWFALAGPDGRDRRRYRYCSNAIHGVCNWLIPADSPDQFCAACRHNRTIPDLSLPENLTNWRKIEGAKHRLFYTLLKLRLPLKTRIEEPETGLAFDFMASPPQGAPASEAVMTGHDSGVITINLAEADDSERERMRHDIREPYRALLGHFRHEIAHYYWDRLVRDSPSIDEFRRLFGDEREDYGAALHREALVHSRAHSCGGQSACRGFRPRSAAGGHRRAEARDRRARADLNFPGITKRYAGVRRSVVDRPALGAHDPG